ncbi:MAG: hypothetical protein V1810_03830 [Candidatus Beckwithbacteria bacterium]
MVGHEVFDQIAEVNSFKGYRAKLAAENPDLSPEIIFKQALIGFNTMMFPRQVETYLAEKAGELVSQVEQKYEVVDGRLVDPFYGLFQKMIDFASSDEERETLIAFEKEAIGAKPGEIINVLDASALGRGGGVKYMDTFEKEMDGSVRHKDRIDLTGEGEDLSFEEAKLKLEFLKQSQDFEEILVRPTRSLLEGKGLQPLATAASSWDAVGRAKPARLNPEVEVKIGLVFQSENKNEEKEMKTVEPGAESRRPTRTDLVGEIRTVSDVALVVKTSELDTETTPLIMKAAKPEEPTFRIEEIIEAPATSKIVPKVTLLEIQPAMTAKQSIRPTKFVFGVIDPKATVTPVVKTSELETETTPLIMKVVRPEAVIEPAEEEGESLEARVELEVKTSRTVLVGPEKQEIAAPAAGKPTRRDLVGIKEEGIVYQAGETEIPEIITPVISEEDKPIPIYQVRWPKLQPLIGIPEWVWQPQAASIDEAVDWNLFLVIVFYALLNTKSLLRIDREDQINDWPGEGVKEKVKSRPVS